MKIAVFAGTTEGRKLIESLSGGPLFVTAFVATEYGETLLSPAENLTVHAGRLDRNEMEELFCAEIFDLIVDATHPYAEEVSKNLRDAAQHCGILILRLLRENTALDPDRKFAETACKSPSRSGIRVFETAADAVKFLNGRTGGVFLSTGSKELSEYARMTDFQNRVTARVLPLATSLAACAECGLAPARIVAMQGPFSQELNEAMFRSSGAEFLVTKDTGTAGGFDQKLAAAHKLGMEVLLIGRPDETGLSPSAVMAKIEELFPNAFPERKPCRKAVLAGAGLGNPETMTLEAAEVFSKADIVFGAPRLLESVRTRGKKIPEFRPERIADLILENKTDSLFAVALSGDPGFYSAAKKLSEVLKKRLSGDSACSVATVAGVGSMSYLCARLGESWEDVCPVSLHARKQNLAVAVRTHEKVFSLLDSESSTSLCKTLTEFGLGDCEVSFGENLSYPAERITTGLARELRSESFGALCAVLIRNPRVHSETASGIPDDAFVRRTDVPMTKSEVRAVTLSKLRLRPDSVVWDVGAGSGSVSVECALQAWAGSCFAVEFRENAVALISENRRTFSADNLEIVSGRAPEALVPLPPPTHAFIGGSAGNLHEILDAVLAKNPNARIVVNTVTLETLAEITALSKSLGKEAEVTEISVSKARKLRNYHLMTAQNPVFVVAFGGNRHE